MHISVSKNITKKISSTALLHQKNYDLINSLFLLKLKGAQRGSSRYIEGVQSVYNLVTRHCSHEEVCPWQLG